jgi:hypothetical protein
MIDKIRDRGFLRGSSKVDPSLQEQEKFLCGYLDHAFGEGMSRLIPHPPERHAGQGAVCRYLGGGIRVDKPAATSTSRFREILACGSQAGDLEVEIGMAALWSQDKYTRAMEFAAYAHGDQRVPGRPFSYVVHLANVSMEVMAVLPESRGVRFDLALQCAILHDVLEDTPVGAEEIEAQFGPEVRAGVQALTKNKKLPRSERMKDSLRRILRQPVEIGLVKMADRISNLVEPPEDWLEDKVVEYYEEAVLILQNLGHCGALLADRLKERIDAYKRYLS